MLKKSVHLTRKLKKNKVFKVNDEIAILEYSFTLSKPKCYEKVNPYYRYCFDALRDKH